MTGFLQQIQDVALARVKNMLFVSFVLAWMAINYDLVLVLFFSVDSIEEKIKYIKSFPFTITNSFLFPLLIVLFYQLALPLLNLLLTILQDKFVNKYVSNHKNKTLKDYYSTQKEVALAKAEYENIARRNELELRKEELALKQQEEEFENKVSTSNEVQTIPEDLVAADETVAHQNDTIVVPAKEDGFKKVFLGQNSWYAIPIDADKINQIKYIAAYQTAPISAVTHYAEVKEIIPYGNTGKYKVVFKVPAQQINAIPLGSNPKRAIRNSRYTSFEKLQKAKEITDLF